MLPRRFLQRSATIVVSSRRRSYAYLHRITSSNWFLRFINYIVIFSSYYSSSSRLLSFFLSRDQYQGRLKRASLWILLISLLFLFPNHRLELLPVQEGVVFVSMWSVSNLKDRARLLFYIRLFLLECGLCLISGIWDTGKTCNLYQMFGWQLASDSFPALDTKPLPPSSFAMLEEGIEDEDGDEDFPPEPNALISLDNSLTIYNFSSYGCCCAVNWVVWLCRLLFSAFM